MVWFSGFLHSLNEFLALSTCFSYYLNPLQQPLTPSPEPQSLRPLDFGALNFIHTTDTHGWLAGHVSEANFGADFGDVTSFVELMREKTARNGQDLIVLDTGDRHDGSGLVDTTNPPFKKAMPIFQAIDYDLVTIGNHELYKEESILQEYNNMFPFYNEKYVVSNVDVKDNDSWVPMGNKYRLFKTPHNKLNVLGMAFLFDMVDNNKEFTSVTRIEDETEKLWFTELMDKFVASGKVDIIVLFCHIPVRDAPGLSYLFKTIRSANETVPIYMFGGHSHVRDFKIYDDRAVALESGRFCETVGWASVNISHSEFEYSRRYIDSNTRSFAFHTGTEPDIFGTRLGKQVSRRITDTRISLNLDEVLAYIPQTYYFDRAPYPSSSSIYTLLQKHVLNLLPRGDRDNTPSYVILNTGAVRYDLVEGNYTLDSKYTVSPFKADWCFIKDLPREVADQVLPILNSGPPLMSLAAKSRYRPGQLAKGSYPKLDTVLTDGYVTVDDLGHQGDDTVHKPWRFHQIPNAIQAERKVSFFTTRLDLIFPKFLSPRIESVLNVIGREGLYKPSHHEGPMLSDLIAEYFR